MAFSWLINGDDPNHMTSPRIILQVGIICIYICYHNNISLMLQPLVLKWVLGGLAPSHRVFGALGYIVMIKDISWATRISTDHNPPALLIMLESFPWNAVRTENTCGFSVLSLNSLPISGWTKKNRQIYIVFHQFDVPSLTQEPCKSTYPNCPKSETLAVFFAPYNVSFIQPREKNP